MKKKKKRLLGGFVDARDWRFSPFPGQKGGVARGRGFLGVACLVIGFFFCVCSITNYFENRTFFGPQS